MEVAKALEIETGNVNENIARAIERQVEEREKESDDTDPWRDTKDVTAEAGRYEMTRGDDESWTFSVDKEGNYWDETSGRKLDTEEVQRARLEEINQIHEHKVYTKVPIEQCWTETGKGPIRVRWLDINKGDEVNREYRSRLVAMEIKRDKRDDLFAAPSSGGEESPDEHGSH